MATLTISFTPPSPVPANGYVVKYRVKGTTGAYTSTTVSGSPAVITGLAADTSYEGTIESYCGTDLYSTVASFITCACPSGFDTNANRTLCYKLTTSAPTPPTGGTAATTVTKVLGKYGTFGTIIYPNNFDPTTGVGTGANTLIPLSNPFWVNGPGDGVDRSNTADGPLNRTGLWTSFEGSFQKVGFSVCLNIPTTKTYYVGIGADNIAEIRLDGVTKMTMNDGAMDPYFGVSETTFKYWHIYPIIMAAGPRILEVVGTNYTAVAALGVEVYDATKAEIMAATSYTDLGSKLILSTKDKRGQQIQIGNQGYGYECPSGAALDTCGSSYVCRTTETQNCF